MNESDEREWNRELERKSFLFPPFISSVGLLEGNDVVYKNFLCLAMAVVLNIYGQPIFLLFFLI